MSRSVRTPRHAGWYLLAVAAIGFVVIIVGSIVFLSRSGPQQAAIPAPKPVTVPHFIDLQKPGASRVLVIANADQTLPGTSNVAGLLMANLRTGTLPNGATQATVLTDSNCTPDADGISHCLNDLNIGGVVVTVQHHHAMAQVPCLSPGEKVDIMTFAQYQQQS